MNAFRRIPLALGLSACAVLCAAALLMAVRPSRAAELIPPKSADRKFPQGVFCPLPFDMIFVADGPTVTLRFSTPTVNYLDHSGSTPEVRWAHQQIDNICVVEDSTYRLNSGPLGVTCYLPPGGVQIDSTFYFQNVSGLPLEETFDDGSPAPGWDLSHGAWLDDSDSGPFDPGTNNVFNPAGCLALGDSLVSPSLTDSAYTTRVVTGVTAGRTYRLVGWWDVKNMELGEVFLTVAVFGDGAVPLVRRSWGALKQAYR